jgi:hypothetical protein
VQKGFGGGVNAILYIMLFGALAALAVVVANSVGLIHLF